MSVAERPEGRPIVLVVQNDVTCPAGLIGEWLLEDGLDLRILAAHGDSQVPARVPDDVDAVVSLGGVIGANDDAEAPWLVEERALLLNAVQTGVPVLGLCLGGQLLAAATGGAVSMADITEIGVTEVHRTLDGLGDPVIGQAIAVSGDTVPAAQWHLDHISELPDGAVLLMTNADCRVQAFRLGESAYGLQMHPEVTVGIVREWVAGEGDTVPRTDRTPMQALASMQLREVDLMAAWRPAIRAWGDMVWMRARTIGTVGHS
jgi:GMP synthase (glutamine-hydrolysing)